MAGSCAFRSQFPKIQLKPRGFSDLITEQTGKGTALSRINLPCVLVGKGSQQ